MDMLYIQGTQLAKLVHVDRTIISRWKNGRAELNMKSAYFEDVVEAILDINEEQGKMCIRDRPMPPWNMVFTEDSVEDVSV